MTSQERAATVYDALSGVDNPTDRDVARIAAAIDAAVAEEREACAELAREIGKHTLILDGKPTIVIYGVASSIASAIRARSPGTA